MIGILVAIFRGSLVLQIATAAAVAWGVWAANNVHQRNVGASRLAAKIEKKADDNAKAADAVRDDVAAGKRGLRNPYQRPGQ